MLTLVYGGSGSGKSEYAEMLCGKENGKRYYIATMQPYGEEAKQRIARHKTMRAGKGFVTIEQYVDIHNALQETVDVALVECLSNLVANEMFGEAEHENTTEYILTSMEKLQQKTKQLVVVTNDVFSDGIVYNKMTMDYRKVLADVNCRMAKKADRIYEVVFGIGLKVK
ncbi:bifunctional adenosylcobinamide kinase/adenosylcobinamide-phosphate guanylyltransferase [Eubacterium oxidoreducens]|uniref:Adenosylcobinamide kinase n=1 Tax=Eubacterium oxidoreducens TaxID=1732 RepID=A0A1G6BI72_EUBOX|nr:bifunctional adenosylcobinamide kinase/adenosylcobinamide-phosphate guanylyltransferase [Eubacterium oxidoreducens]SDB20269.1 adenosylcobinamide kinase /adenosylcobinamide-phosphate guanylyltransferase [Eubacterium oxidoreducens]